MDASASADPSLIASHSSVRCLGVLLRQFGGSHSMASRALDEIDDPAGDTPDPFESYPMRRCQLGLHRLRSHQATMARGPY